jgi:hypothetical protein
LFATVAKPPQPVHQPNWVTHEQREVADSIISKTNGAQEFMDTLRGIRRKESLARKKSVMDSPQHCQEQAAECLRLAEKAQSEDEAQVLRNISSSWSRLAGQIDRYNGSVRDQNRKIRK